MIQNSKLIKKKKLVIEIGIIIIIGSMNDLFLVLVEIRWKLTKNKSVDVRLLVN